MSEAAIVVLEITKDTTEGALGICESANCKTCCGDSNKTGRFANVITMIIGLLCIVDIAMDTAAITDIKDSPLKVEVPINESLASALSSCTSKWRQNSTEEYRYSYNCYNSSIIGYSYKDVRTVYYVFLAISWALFVGEMVMFVLFALIPIFAKKTIVEMSRALNVGKAMALCIILLEDLPLAVLKLAYTSRTSSDNDITLIEVSAFFSFFTGCFKFMFAFLCMYTFPSHYEKATGKSPGFCMGRCILVFQLFAEAAVASLSLGAFINTFSLSTTCDCSKLGDLL